MQVIHEFVDNDGETHIDEFRSSLPLDMKDIPQTAHVLLMLRSNARRIAELWKECDDGTGARKLYIGCPSPGLPEIGKWKVAQLRVRQLGFENPDYIHGGLRLARIADYVNARVVSLLHETHRSIIGAINDLPEGQRTNLQKLEAAQRQLAAADKREIINTVSAHPLWKRLSWIANLDPLVVCNIIGTIVDPTWYVHPDDPARCGLFKERCGLYDLEMLQHGSAHADVFIGLSTPLLSFLEDARGINLQKLNKPNFFFVRYAFRWMQHYLSIGEDEHGAFIGGLWRHNLKLANFIWLSWMEITHLTAPVHLDEERFFFGDKHVISAAYKAAVS